MPIRDHNPASIFPIVTVTLILINVLVFLYQFTLTEIDLERFIYTYALVPSQVDFGNLSTLLPFITRMFLHGGIFHLLSNMLFLWIFGDNVEAHLGRFKFIFFYLLAGMISAFIQYLFLTDADIPVLGASGAIAGLLGGYLVLFPKARIDVIVPIFFVPALVPVPAFLVIIYWFITQLISGIGSLGVVDEAVYGGIAWWAHIAGFVVGFITIRVFSRPKDQVFT
jgi:membrane associated rhomboid family serine protease